MPLSPGTCLGHRSVTALLGEGGMGTGLSAVMLKLVSISSTSAIGSWVRVKKVMSCSAPSSKGRKPSCSMSVT